MSDVYYDLNGRENCNTAVISIADRQFRIDRVVIGARVIYSNHLKRMGMLLEEVGSSNENDEEAMRKLIDKAEAFQQEKMDVYAKVLRLILSKNGYEYDAAWWEENTDEIDQRTFIEKCMMKDNAKKKEETKTSR